MANLDREITPMIGIMGAGAIRLYVGGMLGADGARDGASRLCVFITGFFSAKQRS